VPSCNRKLGSEKRRTVRPASLRQKLVPLAKMPASRRGRSADGNPGTYSVCLDAPLRGMPTLAVSFQRSFSSVVGADIAARSGEVARLGSASTLTILEVYLLSSCRVVRERSA
jgi:hypothetical protein